jgi:hypothetical protein
LFLHPSELPLNSRTSLRQKPLLQEFDNDLEKVEEIKEVIRTDVNPYMFEYSEDNLDYVPTNYEDLLFFSLDSNSILDVVEEKYFSQQVKQKSDDISIFSLNQFDKLLYDRIIQNPKLINSVTWREFEYLLSKILEEFEYEVELQKGTKDGGIDIIAIKNDHVVGKHKYLIQAKKWKNKVGVEPVQQLAFLREHHNATKACLVTTSSFTSGAWELAKLYPWQLELRDYDGLLDWIKLVGIKK